MGALIDRTIEFSARNRAIVLITAGAAVLAGMAALRKIPLDAIPDLSDTQVIIFAKWDRPPRLVEDQVTYPVVSALLGAPGVKDIRGFSDYGFSYVYIVFEDGTDVYWARSRVLEYLSKVTPQLPPDAKVELGPDATGVGWIFEYALVDRSGRHSLEDLTAFQNWHLRYALQSVRGVAEVATVGGFVKQYQVVVDPDALRSYGIPLSDVVGALRRSNSEAGARLIEFSGREYMVTIRGYIQSIRDIEGVVVKSDGNGVPVTVGNLARVQFGPDIRRGVADLDGEGEVVGGIVVMRYRENALRVIERVKERLRSIPLPEGAEIVVTYDRSDLILAAVRTLRKELLQEMAVVAVVILVFLLHIPSALIPIITLPIAVMLSFIPIYFMGLTANVMSLGGIAIAIGAMVDASIVVVENAHKKLSSWEESGRRGDYRPLLIEAMKEVGGPSFYSLLVIAVAFIPIFTLEGYEGRLFKPLAFTKNFAMFFAALLAITLDPAVRFLFTRLDFFRFRPRWLCGAANHILVGRIRPEEGHPVSRFLFRAYGPVARFAVERPRTVIAAAILAFAATVPFYFRIGSEFMPPLNEGAILYMPTTPPGISVAEAARLLRIQDRILKSFPEVSRVFGKAGRAETSTDPAPFSMMETVVVLRPQWQWPRSPRWYSGTVPRLLHPPLRLLWPDRPSWEDLVARMDAALRLPGQVNAWTMPIKGRIDMLTTGVRTPVGIKIFGDDLDTIEELGAEAERLLGGVPGTRGIYAERTSGGYFVDIDLKRDRLARYGLVVGDVQAELMSAIGGENITLTVEGRERFPLSVRYPRERRDEVEELGAVRVSSPSGAAVPLAQIADIRLGPGPSMIRDENGRLAGYVYIDVAGRDLGGYVAEAKGILKSGLRLPPGYSLLFSGQYEFMERVRERMKVVLPLTLFLVFLLIQMNTRSYAKTFIVLLAVPFSLIGVVWILYLLGYRMSVGVWAGIIALLGVDAETGVFMLLYLDLSYEGMKRRGLMRTAADLKEAVLHGAVKRIRPKMMTVGTTFLGLLPVMWAQSYDLGADVTKRIAAPMVGGIFVSFLMELAVYPAIYYLWKKRSIRG